MPSKEKETWRNATKGRVGVLRFDPRGELDQELVRSGGTILLTPDERIVNSDMAYNEDMDIFKNGRMVPVRLLDTTEDAAEIAANPNLKSEDDLRGMFKLKIAQFESEVGKISNITTLERLREIAQEGDATVRQVNSIEGRIADVDPSAHVVDATIQNYGSVSPRKKTSPSTN